MRTRAGWLALVVAGGLASAPAAWAQGGLDVGRASPVVPLPIYHDRADSTGGFYTALQFIMFRQTRIIAPRLLATGGLVDSDGSIRSDLNGSLQVTPGGVVFFLPGPLGPRGAFIGSNTPALLTSDVNKGPLTYEPGLALTA